MEITANDEPTEIEADVDKRFSSIIVNLPVQQTGTGTPSPSNPRPFTMWTDVSLYVSDTEEADEPTLAIELPTPMYGGKIDMIRGEIATLYNSKESGTDWEMTEEGQFRCQVSAYNNGDETSTNVADLYAVHYETVSNKDAYDATDDLTCGLATIDGTTYLYVNDAQYTTLDSFATHIAEEVFVFRAHIPMSDVTEPHIVYLSEGTSYVWADAGFVDYTVSGTPPLSLPNSLGKPLKAWLVELSPYQEGSGDPAPDNVRPIHGTDKVTIYTDSKYGGTVEWNQIQRFDVGTSISVGVTYTLNNDGSISCSGTSTGNSYINIGNTIDNVLNHVLYIRGCPSGGSISTFYYRDGYNGNSAERDIGNGRITKGRSRFVGQIAILEGTDATGLVFKPQCFDLTKMFGATKAEEIYAMEQAESGAGIAYFRSFFPNDFYAYNAGQQMTVDQVNGAQYSPAVLTLPQTVYTATIGESGGESMDAIVDLGTLDWSLRTYSDKQFFTAPVPNAKVYGTYDVPNWYCEAYKPVSVSNFTSAMNTGYITHGVTGFYVDYVCICNTDYSTGEELKASLQGVKLVYELATPTTFALTTPTIPTPSGTATTWATAEDGTVDVMEVTYIGKA